MNLSPDLLRILIKIAIGFEVLAAITGTIYYYKYKNTPVLKYFIFILWYIVLNEIVGLYTINSGNAIIHNIYNVINFTYILVLYERNVENKINRKIITAFCILYLTSFIINSFYENYIIEFQRLPYIIAALSIVISISLYFREILNSEKVLHTKNNLLFWLSIGWLLYYAGNTPFRIIRNYYDHLTDATIITLVNLSLGTIMYICFIIGFICSNRKQPY